MVENLAAGEYDLMGGTLYAPEFEQYFAYPDYNTGYTKSVLLARKDDHSLNSYDYRSLNGKPIGVYANAKENIRRLQEFLRVNAIDCTLIYYTREQLADGGVYHYLENGSVDLVLDNSTDMAKDFRVAAVFDSQSHYIVAQPGNDEILAQPNQAPAYIMDSNPEFSSQC